jgi:hypothetical protein
MTRIAAVLMAVALVSVWGWGCVAVAPVIQGKVVAVEQGGGVLRVQDEEAPDRPPLQLDVRTAEIGATPAVGDRVRIAYEAGTASNRALRVMNLSRQQSDK